MSETKHTPGPWKSYEENDGGEVKRLIFAEMPDRNSCDRETCVCEVTPAFMSLDPEWTEEDDANAALIAAAPDLLAALDRVSKSTLNGFTYCPACQYVADAGHAAGCYLAAAIARATGGVSR